MNENVQRIQLSDEVQRFIVNNEEYNEVHQVLNIAADYYRQHHIPMTLESALAEIRRIAAQIEALG